ncbi:hypothetical protein ACFV1W_25235 [Kitasatospora sp. NPDC059648]|uniref:hypothetical protein n=1 Tax=Kitasatospora sp. NPDC059648 TaxID=3346894 RepID=UPI00368FAAA9
MPAPRGRQQRGRSAEFPPDKVIRAAVNLAPGDPLRADFEHLVKTMGVSGAEVVRTALQALAEHRRPTRRHREEAAGMT